MRNVSRAVARAAAAGADQFPGAYLAALAAGREDIGLSRASELQLGPLGLLVLALVRMPDLFVYCHLLEASDLDPPCERLPPVALVRVWILAGAALRLAYRALESHAQTAGERSCEVETTIRLTDAYTQAAGLLEDSAAMPDGSPLLLEQAHHALWALGDAAAATGERNPRVLCERLSDAIARLLVVFTVASELAVDEPVLRLAEA
jgi:hypothetical protein